MPFIEAPNFRSAKTCRLCRHSAYKNSEVPYCERWEFHFSFIDWKDKVCDSFEEK